MNNHRHHQFVLRRWASQLTKSRAGCNYHRPMAGRIPQQQQQQQQQQKPQQQQRRSVVSLSLDSVFFPYSTGRSLGWNQASHQADLQQAITLVQKHDPAGYLPGRLLPLPLMQVAYFAVRGFWIETGLRFTKSSSSTSTVGNNALTPHERLEEWQAGIFQLFASEDTNNPIDNNPTLRLLQTTRNLIKERQSQSDSQHWQQSQFDTILQGRRMDLDVKQYDTMEDLIHHAEQSCGELTKLVLLSGGIDAIHFPVTHEVARLIGICHGLTNALRTSIPVLSTTGKLIVPADLCVQYGVKSPRYLLSALGQGDEACKLALRHCIRDIAETAQQQLHAARELQDQLRDEHETSRNNNNSSNNNNNHTEKPSSYAKTTAVFLPGLAAETFLTRLEQHDYQLTDRNLRSVSRWEHGKCAWRMLMASMQQQY